LGLGDSMRILASETCRPRTSGIFTVVSGSGVTVLTVAIGGPSVLAGSLGGVVVVSCAGGCGCGLGSAATATATDVAVPSGTPSLLARTRRRTARPPSASRVVNAGAVAPSIGAQPPGLSPAAGHDSHW
jgi:hypothetical protein